jgi:hypothetical protein
MSRRVVLLIGVVLALASAQAAPAASWTSNTSFPPGTPFSGGAPSVRFYFVTSPRNYYVDCQTVSLAGLSFGPTGPANTMPWIGQSNLTFSFSSCRNSINGGTATVSCTTPTDPTAYARWDSQVGSPINGQVVGIAGSFTCTVSVGTLCVRSVTGNPALTYDDQSPWQMVLTGALSGLSSSYISGSSPYCTPTTGTVPVRITDIATGNVPRWTLTSSYKPVISHN